MTDDFTTPETFTAGDHVAKGSIVPMVILGIPLFLVSWLLFALITNAIKLPAATWIGFAAAIVFTALMVKVRMAQVARGVSTISLTIDPQGMTYTGDSATRSIAWQDMRQVQQILPMRAVDAKSAARGVGFDSIAASGGQAGVNFAGELAAHLTAGTGIVGHGPLRIDESMVAKEAWRQNVGRNGTDPQTGEPYQWIPLAQFEPRWHEHRIGVWLRHYRPDLAAQADEVVPAHPSAQGGAKQVG
ncbi:hypothetical protein GCM10027418_04720 [Mariniluteicoccus endophyticus]